MQLRTGTTQANHSSKNGDDGDDNDGVNEQTGRWCEREDDDDRNRNENHDSRQGQQRLG
jgi:hypothetical protein